MFSTTMHRVLAKASEHFGVELFGGQDLAKLVTASLDETSKWQKRDCALTAPFVVFFVLAMALYRPLSIKCLLKQLLGWMRALAPSLSLRSVTPEAMCHAKTRLGVEPMKVLFEKKAA